MIVDFLVSLSLANLCFVRVWKIMLFSEECSLYARAEATTRRQMFLTLISVILFAIILFFALFLIHYAPISYRDDARSLFLSMGSAVAAFQLLVSFPRKAKHFWQNFTNKVAGLSSLVFRRLSFISISIGFLFLIVIYITLVTPLLLTLSPLTVITFGLSIFYLIKPREPFTKKTPAKIISHPPSNKIIWLLLDEFDQRLGFESRPFGLNLPNFDKFIESSLYATQALPPCHCTEISIPALLTGKMVNETIVSANECILCFDPPLQNKPLTSCKTIFELAREKGFNCALSGWYHPYDRLMGDQLVACRWYDSLSQENTLPKPNISYIFGLLRSLIETPRYSLFGQSIGVKKWILRWNNILRDTIEFSTRQDLDLIFLHWNIPHSPYIFDTKTKTTTLKNSPLEGYFGNLELADQGFGQLLNKLDDLGELGNTTFVISSDHWWRSAAQYDGQIDQRVPFIVKLSNSNEKYLYKKRFNTVLTANLVLELLEKKITNVHELASWLDTHSKDIPPTKGFSAVE